MATATAEREYTEEEIYKLTSTGYISLRRDLWDHIPNGAHIRYVKKDNGQGLTPGQRFKPGGFVRTRANEGKTLIICNNIKGKRGDPDYISFPLAYDNIETIWKKYDYGACIEILLTQNSLARKSREIDALQKAVAGLERQCSELAASVGALQKVLTSREVLPMGSAM